MRDQKPSIQDAVNNLVYQGVTEMFVIPLFPQWAMSSFETAAERARQVAAEQAPHMNVSIAKPFYDHPDYISALVENAKPFLNKRVDHLLFSFHGLPERHLHKADPTGHHPIDRPLCCDETDPSNKTCYRAHCLKTATLFAREAGLQGAKY